MIIYYRWALRTPTAASSASPGPMSRRPGRSGRATRRARRSNNIITITMNTAPFNNNYLKIMPVK